METRRSSQSHKTLLGKFSLSQEGEGRSIENISDSFLFRNSPLSVWLEDFSDVKIHFESLRKKGVLDFRGYFEAHPEEVIALAEKVRLIDVNEAALNLFGAESKEALLRGLDIIFDKHSYDTFKEELLALAEGRTEFCSEAVNRTLLGKELKVLLHLMVPPGCENTLSLVVVQLVDIIALSAREDEFRRSEEKYRRLFQHACDAVLLASVETGIILEANEEAGRLFGIPAGQIVGMHFTELHPKEEAADYRLLFEKHKASDRVVSGNLFVTDRGGRRVPVSFSSSIHEVEGKRYLAGVFHESRELTPAADSRRTSEQSGCLTSQLAGGLRERRKVPRASDRRGASNSSSPLTPREREIVGHIASGLTGRHIAQKLSISEKTVETHRSRLMKKLGFHRTAELVRYAINMKIV